MSRIIDAVEVKVPPTATGEELVLLMLHFGAVAADSGVDHYLRGYKWPEYWFRKVFRLPLVTVKKKRMKIEGV